MDADRRNQTPAPDRRALLNRLRRLKRGSLVASLAGFAALVGLAATTGHGGEASPAQATTQPATGDSSDNWGSDWGSTQVSPAPTTQAPAASSGAS